MATFEEFDVDAGDPAALVNAILVPNSGINLVPGSVTFRGGTVQTFDPETFEQIQSASASFYDGSIQELGIGAGILLTSGDGSPPLENTQSGYSGSFMEGGQEGDPDLQAVADAAFEGSGESLDVTFLEFTFTVDNILVQKGVQFDLVFGSDEFPEFTDSSFVDVAGVFVNGQNVALFNQNDNQPLSIISENNEVGNFRSNGDTGAPESTPVQEIPLEYDGISSGVKIVAPLQPGQNTIKIGVADTGDQVLDSGLFVSKLATSATGGGGLLSTVPGTDGDDELTGGDANEFLDGGGGNDTLDPGGGNDVVSAGAGDDSIVGGNGDNNIDGGPGNDTVTYAAPKADLPTVVIEGGALQVGTNTDTLANVETLQFQDQSVPTSDITGKDLIGKIYVGYYGRAPDPDGVNFWLDQLKTNEQEPGETRGAVLDDIANSFSVIDEAQSLFPFFNQPNPDTADIESFVTTVFQNLFNRGAGEEGRTFWTQQIQSELDAGRPVGSIILDIMSGAQNTGEVLDATTVQNKAQVALLFAEELSEAGLSLAQADFDTARSLVADVTSDAASVDTARAEIDAFVSQEVQALTAADSSSVEAFA